MIRTYQWMLLLLFIAAIGPLGAQQSQTQSQPQTKEGQEPQTGVTVTYEVLQQGTYSGVKVPLQQIIKNKKDWQDLWKKHVSLLVPQPPLPEIDFETSVIVAISSGEKNTSGYQILLKSVGADGDNVAVHYRQTEPPANSLTLQVITQPFVFLRVDKPKGEVLLIKE